MARGGKRPGAGRKAGSPNKATAERQKAIEESGLTPLEYMLTIMRDEAMTPESRFEAAKAAAPYVHPKLAAVEHTSPDGTMSPGPSTIQIVAADDDCDTSATS